MACGMQWLPALEPERQMPRRINSSMSEYVAITRRARLMAGRLAGSAARDIVREIDLRILIAG